MGGLRLKRGLLLSFLGGWLVERDRVVAPLGEGVASEDSGGGEEGATDWAMDAVGLECVSGA